jgi:hypothetical protein
MFTLTITVRCGPVVASRRMCGLLDDGSNVYEPVAQASVPVQIELYPRIVGISPLSLSARTTKQGRNFAFFPIEVQPAFHFGFRYLHLDNFSIEGILQ